MNLVGKADISRPTRQFLKTRVDNFKVDHSFSDGGVFIASGNKI